MKSLFILVLLCGVINLINAQCTASLTTVAGTEAPQKTSFCSGELIFEDNFDFLDHSKWKHENTVAGGGNWEFQWYINDRLNSYTFGGVLHFRPTFTSDIFGEKFLSTGRIVIDEEKCTQPDWNGCDRQGTPENILNPIRSARVSTWDSFRFRFGTLEIRAKMPAGDWLWPALWMMPRFETYGGWPRSGEIDLVEMRGNRELYDGSLNVGVNHVGSTLHFGPDWIANGWPTATQSLSRDPGFDQDFHVYRVEWTPTSIRFLYDNMIAGTVEAGQGFWVRGGWQSSIWENPWADGTIMAPFDQQFYIIMNLAVGGVNFFADGFENRNSPKPWRNDSPTAPRDFWNARSEWEPTWNRTSEDSHMQVDYVRVWALITMRKLILAVSLFAAVGLASACTPTVTTASGTNAPSNFCSGDLIFEDNFNTLDQQKWRHENTLAGGGNWEFQWYVNDRFNSYTFGGVLHFRPTYTSDVFGEAFLTSGRVLIPADECTESQWYGCDRQGTATNIINPIRSARITTWDSFRFRFGTLEIRAKMPAGDWLWPALWLMPRFSLYGTWPRSGEIDLMEGRGNRQLFNGNTNVGVEQAGSTMHFGPDWTLNGWPTAHYTQNRSPGFDANFHVYKLIWTQSSIQFLYDNQVVGTVEAGQGFWARGGWQGSGWANPWTSGTVMAPFDQEFYIIMNLAIGGTNFFSDGFDNRNSPKPWNNNSPTAPRDFWNGRAGWEPTWNRNTDDSHLQVDYVRVWAL
ncbi:CLUMA_CG009274, isoform A [Clunio marinus]|uniref:CLUMA_CG009274, isoform A n=1 Tax=Clunio marinus TaxID=568069 RepID=A0A1J1IA35_9DIPT|nr:CLUMA_CG009274, isoform A [Clunio marinus]